MNKSEYFSSFSGNDTMSINRQINALEKKRAEALSPFIGALKMKKSGFMKTISEKLNLFNEGKDQLEHGIAKYPTNVELRFLRFAIQENCPMILMYRQNLDEDAYLIRKNILKGDPIFQGVVKNYASTAKSEQGKELGVPLK